MCHHFSVLVFQTPSAMVCAVAKLRHAWLFLFGGAGTAHCSPFGGQRVKTVSEELRELAGSIAVIREFYTLHEL